MLDRINPVWCTRQSRIDSVGTIGRDVHEEIGRNRGCRIAVLDNLVRCHSAIGDRLSAELHPDLYLHPGLCSITTNAGTSHSDPVPDWH